ncbi:2',5'-phosphodiesterase 12 [Ambystoma mexicanum]|uniref:2',5'-phosphodiesterase 12 n=1 Tax=Ambystoma mexicanum TaxID=8296 RepID=UPI0037E77E4B
MLRHTARKLAWSTTACFIRLRACSRLSGMEKAVVRCVPSEPKLTLSFTLDGSQKHMQRDQSEPLGRALARIATNAAKAAQSSKAKKSKRGGKSSPPASSAEPPVGLYFQEQPLPDELLNAEAWRDGAVLHVGEARYTVERNPPAFRQVQLPRHIMAGFPVCPALHIEFGQLEASLFLWFKQAPDEPGGWAPAGRQRVYTPTNSDIGLRLKLHCTPGSAEPPRHGAAWELEASCTVEAGPGTCAFEQRHLYTQRVSEAHLLRIVSYNILADTYAQTEHSRIVLYPYCAPYALDMDYRQTLLRKELSGYNADLLCLQEVDRPVFIDSLCPALDAFGMQGLFKLKEKQHEGLATFYRPEKLTLLSQHDINLSEALQTEPLHSELLESLSAYGPAKEQLLQRTTALQVSVFQSINDPSRKMCVANTHLYFHPKGGNIRLLQSAIALTHIKHVTSELYPGIPVIFCGDFNSTPSSGMCSFFKNGSISEDHGDWLSNGEEERCNMSLTHSFKLKSACGEPAYTNYVGGFHGCLDYIFIDCDALEVEQVIPMPSHEEVTTHQALPSVSHPSDHISLICDLKWK